MNVPMEELVAQLSKAKIENDTNKIVILLKKIGQHLWQKINEENEITIQMADRCLSIYKIYKATNKIAKKDIIPTQEILSFKDFFLKKVLKSSNDPTNFFSRIDEFYKSIREIQCEQAKDVIHQIQETKTNSEKVVIIKECYQKLNISLRKLLYDIIQLSLEAFHDDEISHQAFAVVLFGSWAKDTATPYSDIEFCILVNDRNLKLKEVLRRMVYLMNFIVISLEQTALPLNLFQVSNVTNVIDFDDLLKPGFQFDLGGKTPLGRADKDYDLINTPQDMANYINFGMLEQDPLLVAELIDCRFLFGNEKLYEDYKQMVKQQLHFEEINQQPFHKRMAKVLLQDGTMNFKQADLEKYKIKIDKISYEGRLLNIKAEIYRLPDRLIEGLRLIFATPGETLWEKISGLLKCNIISQAGSVNLEFMTAIALQSRLFTYVTHGSQSERLGIWDTAVAHNNSEIESFLGIDEVASLVRFYQVAIPLYQFVQTSVNQENLDQINTGQNFLDERLITKATICFRFMLYRQAEILLLESQQSELMNAHFQLYRLYSHLGKPQLAYEFYEKYLENKSREISDRFRLGYLKLVLGNHKEALDEYNIILDELEITHQELSMDHVQSHCYIAQIEGLMGNTTAEFHHLEKANEIVKHIPDKHKDDVMIDFYIGYAKYHAGKNQFDRSKHYIQQSLDYTDKLYGKHAHTKLIDIYQQAAEIAQQYNQWEQAVKYREKTIRMISILYVGKIVSRLLDAYIDLTNTLCLMGKLDQAEEQLTYVKCLLPSVEHELTNKALTFKLSYGYMKVYQAKKSYQWAYEHYEKATVYRTTFEENPYYRLQLAKFYLDAFDTWISYDKWEECKQRLPEAINIITELCGRNHSDLAKAYCQLATFDLIQGDNELAKKNLLQSYDIYEKLPKIYPNYLTTLTNLIKVYQNFKDGEKAILYAEKFYQHAEKMQPSSLLESIKCFLVIALEQECYQRVLPYVEKISANIDNLDHLYPESELEHLDYATLEGVLTIKKIRQILLVVQIMSYFGHSTPKSGMLKQNMIRYKNESNKLIKSVMTHRPDIIKLIISYSESINEGKSLLDEACTQLVPRDALVVALLKVENTTNGFNAREYLKNALAKNSINCADEAQFEQLLELTGQFNLTIDMAVVHIAVTGQSVENYCTVLQSLKESVCTGRSYIKNYTCINSYATYLSSRFLSKNVFETLTNKDAHYAELINHSIYHLMHKIGDKAPKALFSSALIRLGFTKTHASDILRVLINLKLLRSENEFLYIHSLIKVSLNIEFNHISYPMDLKAIVEECSLYLENCSQVDSELPVVFDIYRNALLELYHVFTSGLYNDTSIGNFVVFNICNMSSISDNIGLADQKIYLEKLASLVHDKNTEVYAEIITLLAFAERNASNYSQQLRLLQEAHIIKSRLFKSDDPLFAKSLINLARAFGDIKNTEKQRELCAKALEIIKRDYELRYDTLTSKERAAIEVDIVIAMENFAAGHVWFDNARCMELLENCLDFYNEHHLNFPAVKENILSKLINSYCINAPEKALDVYQHWETLQKKLYKEGTQAHARHAGFAMINYSMALSKNSIAIVVDLLDLRNLPIPKEERKNVEEKIQTANEQNLQARQIADKATLLLATFYPKDDYIFTQASDALSNIKIIENNFIAILKLVEGVKYLYDGNLDQVRVTFKTVFEITLNQELKSEALSIISFIDLIQAKEKGTITNRILEGFFKQQQDAINIHDSAPIQMRLSITYFAYDFHEQAIIHAENAIQRLYDIPDLPKRTNMFFDGLLKPILPIVLQMILGGIDKIKYFPINFLARYVIINSSCALGHTHNEAQMLKEFALLISSNETAISHLLLGFCYQRQGNWILALQAFNDAYQKQPNLNLGRVSVTLAQFCIKFSDIIDAMDMNMFKEIRVINTILSDSNLTQQLDTYAKSNKIDVNEVKLFVKAINGS